MARSSHSVTSGPVTYWVAVHERTSQTLTIAAQHVDPASLDLRPLRDPIAELSWDDPF